MIARLGLMLVEGAVMAVGWKAAEKIVTNAGDYYDSMSKRASIMKRETINLVQELAEHRRYARREKLMAELAELNHDPRITIIDMQRGE